MAHLPTLSIGLAAALFCGVSATMNAMFLSSLGRTGTESLIFVALSIAGDVTKATLPVVIVRCLEVRAWGHVSAAAAMLGVVTLLSVASGAGFAATTRSGVVAERQDVADRRASLQSRRDELATRRAQLPAGRTVRAADAELAHAAIDRRWAWSKQCSEISSASIRQFCSEVLRLKAERAVAVDRNDLDAQVAALQVRLESAGTSGQDADPQAAVLAQLLGVDATLLRKHMSVTLAVIIELGSVILILLLSGPALLRWRDPFHQPEPVLAAMPVSSDVVAWQRRRESNRFALKQE